MQHFPIIKNPFISILLTLVPSAPIPVTVILSNFLPTPVDLCLSVPLTLTELTYRAGKLKLKKLTTSEAALNAIAHDVNEQLDILIDLIPNKSDAAQLSSFPFSNLDFNARLATTDPRVNPALSGLIKDKRDTVLDFIHKQSLSIIY